MTLNELKKCNIEILKCDETKNVYTTYKTYEANIRLSERLEAAVNIIGDVRNLLGDRTTEMTNTQAIDEIFEQMDKLSTVIEQLNKFIGYLDPVKTMFPTNAEDN